MSHCLPSPSRIRRCVIGAVGGAITTAPMEDSGQPTGQSCRASSRACRWPVIRDTNERLAAAHRRQDRDRRPRRHRRREAVEEANVLIADEHVDVLSDLTLLGEDAVDDTRPELLERRQRLGDARTWLVEHDDAFAVGVGLQRPGELDGDAHLQDSVPAPTAAPFTQTMGGSPSAIASQLFPSLPEAYSFPLRVPK